MVLKNKYSDTDAIAAIEAAGLAFDSGKYIEYIEALTSNLTASGEVNTFIAGESIGGFQPCYFKSDGKMWKTDADAEATSKGLLGLSLEALSVDVAGKFLLVGFARDDSWAWVTLGGPIYLSGVVGQLTQAIPVGVGDAVRVVGYATHADRLRWCPDSYYTIVP